MDIKNKRNERWPIVLAIPTLFVVIVRVLYELVKPVMQLYSNDTWAVFLTYLSVFVCITSSVIALSLAVEYIYCYLNNLDNYQLKDILGLNEDVVFHKICMLPIITVVCVFISMVIDCTYIIAIYNNAFAYIVDVIILLLVFNIIYLYFFKIRKKRRISKLSFKDWIGFLINYVLVLLFVVAIIAIVNYDTGRLEVIGRIESNGEIFFDINSEDELNEIQVEVVDGKKLVFNADEINCSSASIQSKNEKYTIKRYYNWEYRKIIQCSELMDKQYLEDEIYFIQILCRKNNKEYQYKISFQVKNGEYYQISQQQEIQF